MKKKFKSISGVIKNRLSNCMEKKMITFWRSVYDQIKIKCDILPKNEVCQFIENLCPFCAAKFVNLKIVIVLLPTHINFKTKID